MSRQPRSAESGQVGTWPVLAVAFALMLLATFGFARMAQSTDQATSIQAAADSAALAGAQSIVGKAPGQIVSAFHNGKFVAGLDHGLGRDSAVDFASRNDTTVTSYTYNPILDQVRVTVQSRDLTASGSRERASAVARLGLRLGPCSVSTPPAPSPTPTPTPTTTPTDGPTTPPPSPPDVETTGSCGDFEFGVLWPGDGGHPTLKINASLLKSLVDPRLTA